MSRCQEFKPDKEAKMIDLIEKTVLTGLGALFLTQKKSEEFLTEVKERFDLTEEDGRQLVSRLQDAAKENQKKFEDLAREELQKSASRMGFVAKEEFDALAKKVARLEKQLKAKS
jgi:polyhydroxyalkanoate synthesis regulator phasin